MHLIYVDYWLNGTEPGYVLTKDFTKLTKSKFKRHSIIPTNKKGLMVLLHG